MDLARPSESKALWPPNRILRTELTDQDRMVCGAVGGGGGCEEGE